MKTERRHELQQNDLAVYLGKINAVIEPHSKTIAVVLIAAFILALVVGYRATLKSEQQSASTLDLLQASTSRDAEELERVGKEYATTTAGEWAKLFQGLEFVSQGVEALYVDRQNAEELLNDATAVLEDAAASSNEKLLKSRAHLGIAQAAESLGDLKAAEEAYRQVIAINESEAMVEMSENRIATLSEPRTQEFMTWFAEQKFASIAPPNADPSMPPSVDIPGLPDIDLPDLKLNSSEEVTPRDLEGGLELPEDDMPVEESGKAADGAANSTEAETTEAPLTLPTETSGEEQNSTSQADATSDDADATSDDADATSDDAGAPEGAKAETTGKDEASDQ